jgi:hypothetical protein
VVVAIRSFCGSAAVAAAVGAAGVPVAGDGLVHPAKQAARNSSTNIVEINPTHTSLLIKYTGIMVDKNTLQCFFFMVVNNICLSVGYQMVPMRNR